jgi:hypothetical protein
MAKGVKWKTPRERQPGPVEPKCYDRMDSYSSAAPRLLGDSWTVAITEQEDAWNIGSFTPETSGSLEHQFVSLFVSFFSWQPTLTPSICRTAYHLYGNPTDVLVKKSQTKKFYTLYIASIRQDDDASQCFPIHNRRVSPPSFSKNPGGVSNKT